MTVKIRCLVLTALLAGCAAPQPRDEAMHWYKGNTHTHSLWTDGADFPEMIADWYKRHGYNFLAVTEHDMLQQGGKWVDITAPDQGWPPRNESTRLALPGYIERFGESWVQQRTEGTKQLVRLRGIEEYRSMFEEPGKFLLILSEEITDRGGAHMIALNVAEAIKPQGGATTGERTRRNVEAVEAQRAATGRNILHTINHPNYVWTLTAEEIAAIPDARLFEVWNGHRLVNNEGTAQRASTDRIWDVVLSLRHEAGLPPVYGVASDDAHEYRAYSDTIARPGRGWVMVRAPQLTADALLTSLARGDFYASTGVTLRDVVRDDKHIRVRIQAEPGVTYRTQFIGTRRGASLAGTPVDTLRTTRAYGPGVGEVLEEVTGTDASYRFRGDERYIRAKVVSSKPHTDEAGLDLGFESAWVQPVFR